MPSGALPLGRGYAVAALLASVNAQPRAATDIPALSPAMLMLLAVLVAAIALRDSRSR